MVSTNGVPNFRERGTRMEEEKNNSCSFTRNVKAQ